MRCGAKAFPQSPSAPHRETTKEEALEALRDLTHAYFEVLIQHDSLPEGIEP